MATNPEKGVDSARVRFKDRVREWREQAILQAVAEILVDDGCQHLTMDDLARRVGIAKGSLYLHTTTRDELVEQVLDLWATEVPAADRKAGPGERWGDACGALFAPVDRGTAVRPAIPCCLRQSPCPHGWMKRWQAIAEAHGLPTEGGDAVTLGEAVQALTSLASVRALAADGRIGEARAVVQHFMTGYVERDAPRAT